jgi:hypothetical protein
MSTHQNMNMGITKNNTLNNPGLDATSCDAPYNTTQQLRTCKQGYLDGSNLIKHLFKQMPEYKLGYEIGKVDGNHIVSIDPSSRNAFSNCCIPGKHVPSAATSICSFHPTP